MHLHSISMFSACLLTLCSVVCIPAHAQVTEYNNLSSFEAAASGLTVIDFNDQVTPPNKFTNYSGSTVTLSGVTFTANNILFAVSPSYSPGYDLGDGTVLSFQGSPSPNVLTVALPANTTAVGLNFGGFAANAFTFTLSTGDTYTLTGGVGGSPPPPFVGFTSVAALTSLTISNGSDTAPQIDAFRFGTAATPEPGSIAFLIGLGVSGAGFLARRRRANKGA